MARTTNKINEAQDAAANTAADATAEAAEQTSDATRATIDQANAAMANFHPEAMTEQFRNFAEKGIAQSQEAYARFKSQAEENQKAMEESLETVRGAVQNVSKKSIENARRQSESAFDHVERLMGVSSLSEFVEVQTAFLRKQAEMNIEQAKQMQAVTTGAMEDVAKPARQAFTKAFDGMTH